MSFESAMKFIRRWEGGYVNDPKDPGGATNKGVTQGTYNSWRKSKGLPQQSVRNITTAEVNEIYYKNYWLASGADKLSDGLALIHFDTAVNFGVGRAKQFFAASGGNIEAYYEQRKAWRQKRVKESPSQVRFLKGWNNRDLAVLNEARKAGTSNLAGPTMIAWILIGSAALGFGYNIAQAKGWI